MHSELTAVLEAERTYVCFEGEMKEHAVTYVHLHATYYPKEGMHAGRKIKRETEREGGREKGSEREIEEQGRTCSHIYVHVRTMCS